MRKIADWNDAVHAPRRGGDVVWDEDSDPANPGWVVFLVKDDRVEHFAPRPDYYHDDRDISDVRALEMLQATAKWEGLDPEME